MQAFVDKNHGYNVAVAMSNRGYTELNKYGNWVIWRKLPIRKSGDDHSLSVLAREGEEFAYFPHTYKQEALRQFLRQIDFPCGSMDIDRCTGEIHIAEPEPGVIADIAAYQGAFVDELQFGTASARVDAYGGGRVDRYAYEMAKKQPHEVYPYFFFKDPELYRARPSDPIRLEIDSNVDLFVQVLKRNGFSDEEVQRALNVDGPGFAHYRDLEFDPNF